jgi:heterodisulfide reductase subunit A
MDSSAKPLETRTIPLKPEALVLGGGKVGFTVAQTLARAGIRVTLLVGGHAQDGLEGTVHPNLTLIEKAVLKRVEGHFGRFEAKIVNGDGEEFTCAPSAVVAAYDYLARKSRIQGLENHPGIWSLSELETFFLRGAESILRVKDRPAETVTFLLDQINEDLKIDSIQALRQSLRLQEESGCQAAVLCKDVKVSSDGMERLYRKAREKGVLFIKYGESPRISAEGDSLRIEVKDTAAVQRNSQWNLFLRSDLLVVSDVYLPDPEIEPLARILKLHLGRQGFLMEDNPQLLRVRSNRRGIFVAGGSRFPQDPSESLLEANAAAEEVIALLSKGAYTYELAVAEVDPKKCAVCYTCPRLCPHSAITGEKYAESNTYAPPGVSGERLWGAARVDPVACYGCGICVAECPAKAITLRHETGDPIYAQMNLME